MPAPKVRVLTWENHKKRWGGCRACGLCEVRSHVVLCRGKLPCDVLFVGEAPGAAEDVLGRPFVGPAGKLLDWQIQEAQDAAGSSLRMAFTNLIACIPLDASGRKTVEPPKDSIAACKPRLQEMVSIARPRALVMVGKLSQKMCPKNIDWDFEASADIIHPAAILRADLSQQGLANQKVTVTLRDLFEELTK